jgi:adenylate cyclase
MEEKKQFTTTCDQAQSDIELGSGTTSIEKCSRLQDWARSLSVETGGIQRVTDEERSKQPTRVWNACTFW